MSYQEKRTITSIITGALVLAAYAIYAINRYQAGTLTVGDLRPWAIAMLIFIGAGIVASIVIQIIFHILLSISVAVREKIQDQTAEDELIEKSIKSEMIEDEMDKLIELKSSRFGLFFAGFGLVMSLISIVLRFPPAVMLNILFVSFSIGSLLEGFVQIYYYRRGIHHG